MRVLTVSNLFPPVVVGGAELYAGWLTDHLADRGHDIGTLTLGVDDARDLVATVRPFPYRPETAREHGVVTRSLFHAADLWRPDVARTVQRAIADFEPDVVHTHTVQGMSVAALVASGAQDAAHVHTLHDYWLLCFRSTLAARDGSPCGPACRVLRWGRGAVLRRRPPDVVLSPSQAVFDEHARRGIRFSDTPTHVIPHPVYDRRDRPPRDPDAPPTFGFLGQVNPNKGIGTLVTAFEGLAIDGARLLVAGRGRAVDLVTDREDRGVTYLGWVGPEEKERFFDDIDALVVPSEWPEPAGLVINEAKARGLPVIGARSGGIPEYVPAASRQLLFPSGDAAALTRSMRRVAEEPAAFAPVADDVALGWDTHCERVEAAYDEAVERHE